MNQQIHDVDFALGGDIADLHATLHALRDAAPVARVRYFGEPAYLFTTYDAVEAAYRDDDLFPAAAAFAEMTEPVLGRNLQCMHGAEHRRNRMLVSPYFRLRVMPGHVQPVLEELAHELVDGFVADGRADLVERFTREFPGAVICRLLGIPLDRTRDLQHLAHRLLSFPSDPEGALAARHEITEVLDPLVTARRDDPGDDLISTLVTTEIDGESLTAEEVFSFVRLLFGAGTDTSFFGLGNALFALLHTPGAIERVASDPDAIRAAVEEVLRWESPVSMEPRRAPTETEWFGTPLEAGSRLLFGISAANRDPAVFADPDRFDLSRFAGPAPGAGGTGEERVASIMTFGIGQHFCLGAHLARAELVTALGVLLDRLPGLRIDRDAAPVRIAGTVLRGPASLPVRFG